MKVILYDLTTVINSFRVGSPARDEDVDYDTEDSNAEVRSHPDIDLGMSDNFQSDDENLDSTDSEGATSSGDDQILRYSVEKADSLCIKMDQLIRRGLIPRDGIMYKYLTDVVSQRLDSTHQYSIDSIEFLNTIAYHGGRRTVNLFRGPMAFGSGNRGNSNSNENIHMNFGGASETTRNKHQAGYTPKSGVIHPLSIAHLKLCEKNQVFIINNDTVSVIPAVVSNDGNPLKPAIEYDPRLKCNIGLDVEIDIDFVRKNPTPSPTFLKDHIVMEAVISSVTTLDNSVSLPCVAEYVPKSGKTGENLMLNFKSVIKTLQCCLNCTEKVKTDEHIFDYSKANCCSTCSVCLREEKVCSACHAKGHRSIFPSLRACESCISSSMKCLRRVILVLCADCEEGNKKSFENISAEIKDGSIDPELRLLIVLPDTVHVGKSVKASFSNWWLKIADERSNLSLLRILRNNSPPAIQSRTVKFIPNNDHVRNRDRQDPSSVITLTRPAFTEFLSEIERICCTIIPETTKFTENNRKGMYPKPLDIALGPYGTFFVLFNYDKESGKTDLLQARMHSPVDNIEILRKSLCATSINYVDGVLLMCGEKTGLSYLECIKGTVHVASKYRSKVDIMSVLDRLGIQGIYYHNFVFT